MHGVFRSGILAQGILFIAIFNGISIIWERGLGIDLLVLTAVLGGLIAVSARLYPQIVR